MFYQLRKDTYVRKYGELGYILSVGLFIDRVVDECGSMFLSALEREPQDISDIARKLEKVFVGVKAAELIPDIEEFYEPFVEDGFILKGNNPQEIGEKDCGFMYSAVDPIGLKEDFTPLKKRADNSTQDVLDTYFLEHPTLISFQIELTSKCNERCVHCYIPHEYKTDLIEDELFYGVLSQLKEMGTLQLTLSGGEPMLHPKFPEYLRKAKEMGFYVSVLTNLTLLTDEIVHIMEDGNKTSVQVSLYSMIPEHHDAITTIKGSFDKTKAAILKLIEHNIPLQISCPTMKQNKDDFKDVLIWANEHKVRAVTDYSIMAKYNHDDSNLLYRLTPEECKCIIKDIILYDAGYRELVMDEEYREKEFEYSLDPEARLCGVGVSSCCMVSSGGVYPCAGWQDYTLGNLYEESLESIWKHSEKLAFLRGLRKKSLKKCLNCENAAYCSPCLVRNANESKKGDPLEIAPYFCEVARVNREALEEWFKSRHND